MVLSGFRGSKAVLCGSKRIYVVLRRFCVILSGSTWFNAVQRRF